MENYEIYMKVFDTFSEPDGAFEELLLNKRTLLSQIIPRLTEPTEVDMLYAFLPGRIRDRYPRNTIKTFDELLERAKEADASVKNKNRCSICKKSGHATKDCPNNKHSSAVRVQETTVKQKSTQDTTTMTPTPTAIKVSASQAAIKHLRPGVAFEVVGRREIAFLNTSSNVNIMSVELFRHLKKVKYPFRQTMASVNDFMSSESKKVQVANVEIILEKQKFQVQFVYFEDIRYKVSVLGYDFINKANIWMHLSRENKWFWGFGDTPKEKGLPSIEIVNVLEDSHATIDYLSVSLN
ncbi:hypothetical protein Zmor_027784 [Zophobas morio]|uniref:CCHC-type domain-containing protein n=1 Tax=Zophobas morio TaxID=2755281 RepID=A0AA38M2T8_9CUCU|nr:hypothetical protein Zmor_027784 [Zophobas morio]